LAVARAGCGLPARKRGPDVEQQIDRHHEEADAGDARQATHQAWLKRCCSTVARA